MRSFVLFVLMCACQFSSGQKYDYRWILGYVGNPALTGNTDIFFTDTMADTINSNRNVTMFNSQTTISDSDGNLLFFSNGAKVFNRNDSIMQNGDSINYGDLGSLYYSGIDYNAPEDILGLPTDTSGIWNLIHYYSEYTPDTAPYIYPWRIEQSRIDMRQDTGLGAVVFKNKILVQDTIGGYITANQHANGRDWWLLASKTSTNCLYTLLVQPDTIIQYPIQCLGSDYMSNDYGQAAFSPDGTRFALEGQYTGVNIYDFDRCVGLLSNPIHLPFYWTHRPPDTINYQYGLAFDPNSRFLYVSQSLYILQFDLLDTNIIGKVDTIGKYSPSSDTTSLPGPYYLMQLAPDGKIYVSSDNGTKYLHVINQPNEKGDSCNFVNYGLRLPNYNSSGLPSYPGNYRLGALHGSPCDTLSPPDTSTAGIAKINREKMLKVYPNPASDFVIIDYGFTDWSNGPVELVVYDAIGQAIYTQALPLYSGFQKLDVSHFSSGLYGVAIKRSGLTVAAAKVAVVH